MQTLKAKRFSIICIILCNYLLILTLNNHILNTIFLLIKKAARNITMFRAAYLLSTITYTSCSAIEARVFFSLKYLSASSAAIQPVPAAVTA